MQLDTPVRVRVKTKAGTIVHLGRRCEPGMTFKCGSVYAEELMRRFPGAYEIVRETKREKTSGTAIIQPKPEEPEDLSGVERVAP